jgi:hypothetical protein
LGQHARPVARARAEPCARAACPVAKLRFKFVILVIVGLLAMAEFLNQAVEPAMDPFTAMGKPILMQARAAGYEHCKQMGLDSPRALECVNAVSEMLARDKPYEAMAAGMKFLDLTGVYRLFAVILTVAVEENKTP